MSKSLQWIAVIQNTSQESVPRPVSSAQSVTRESTLAETQRAAAERFQLRVCRGRPSVATSLVGFWDRPWSGNAKRFAYHALHGAMSHGLDVLEAL